MLQLIATGLISILGQVVLLRELSVAFFGIELIYALALGIWLFWTAVGATIGRRTLQPSFFGVNLLFLAYGLLLPLDLAFTRGIRVLFAGVPGAYLPFHFQLLALSISLLPIGLVLGWLFQWVAKQYISERRSLAAAYAVESLGGLAGGILATLFLRFGIQNFTIALICALASLIAVIVPAPVKKSAFLKALVSLAAGLLLFSAWHAATLDRWMSRWNHPQLLDTRDSPYGRITLTESAGQIAVFENDALSFTTEGTEAEEFAHLAALQHPNPSLVLILGGGIEGTVREVLKHGPQRVDYVELNPVLLRIAQTHLPQDIQKSLQAQKARLVVSDPRQFLAGCGAYDLILAGSPEPASGQNNRFYTVEFFEQCRTRLSPGGILAFRLKASENLWTPQLTRRMTSIYRALKSVFREITILPGSTNIFLASREPLSADPSILAARLQARGIQARLVSAAYIRYLYTNDRFAQIAGILAAGNVPANTDTRPICYQYTLMIWLSKFFPTLALPDVGSLFYPSGTLSPLWWILTVVLLVLFFLASRRRSFSHALFVGIAGFIGMVLETILILYYQVKHGILYQDIGVLLMSFMAGLAAGATTIERWLTSSSGENRMVWWRSATLPAGFAFLSTITILYIHAGSNAGLGTTALLLALAGFLVAGTFALAGTQEVQDQRKVVTRLYAADLAGGCLGSLAASLFLVPIMGLSAAALAMVPLSIASLLLSGPRRPASLS